jgi:maltooligosyltrehalose trehalohydrolase
MRRLEVWAPGCQRVDVVLVDDGVRVAASPVGGGWWRADVPGMAEGARYMFSLDGGPGRPDPRSPWQPEGIEGPSAVLDHRAFEWQDGGWLGFPLPEAVLYELHVGTFSPEGTFEGAISRLGHLCELGVNAVELMPVAEASGRWGWGYDGVDLWAPHHSYGGPTGLKRFVDACHRRGLAVVLDVVYNHLGPVGNYLSEFGPYFTDRYKTPWGWAVNFDGSGSHEVRDFVVGNALMWLEEYHIDGLRLDAVHAIFDESALHILEELSLAVARLSSALGRQLWLIAESDRNDPKLVRSRGLHGYGLTACWDDDFHHALHAVLTGERRRYYADFGQLGQLAKALRDVYVYDGQFSAFRQHRHGRPVGDLPSSSFVGYGQNHDQVGNRLLGQRLSALVGTDLLRAGLALVLLGPLVPMLFQGEEWGAASPFLYFTDHADPALGQAVREGRLREHPWPGGVPLTSAPDPQDPATFLRSKLDWGELSREPHRSLLAWCRSLIAVRRAHTSLFSGHREKVVVTYDEEQRWLAVSLRGGRLSVAINLSDVPLEVPLPPLGQPSAPVPASQEPGAAAHASEEPGAAAHASQEPGAAAHASQEPGAAAHASQEPGAAAPLSQTALAEVPASPASASGVPTSGVLVSVVLASDPSVSVIRPLPGPTAPAPARPPARGASRTSENSPGRVALPPRSVAVVEVAYRPGPSN